MAVLTTWNQATLDKELYGTFTGSDHLRGAEHHRYAVRDFGAIEAK